MSDFRKLLVWQKAHALAVDLENTKFRRNAPARSVRQVRTSSASIAANIAEGAGLGLDRFLYHVDVAIGSSREVESHILFLRDVKALPAASADELIARVVEVRRMLYGLRTYLQRQSPT